MIMREWPKPSFMWKCEPSKRLVDKEGILPVATVYFKEGHWQI